jgi:hypothetical protein
MPAWLKWVLVAAAIYLGITEGLPWLQQRFAPADREASGRESTSDEGTACVEAARRTSDAWSGEARAFSSPPIDAAAWSAAALDLRGTLGDARARCGCPLESCRLAHRALSEIDGMIASLDAAAGGGPPPLDLARHMNEADDLLTRAQSLARSGR